MTFQVYADKLDYKQYFKHQNGCFILYNLQNNQVEDIYNEAYCHQRFSPNSTFKIALSVMAFDNSVINSKTQFVWDKNPKYLPEWQQDQTPMTWLTYSVVWVSQVITPQLGMKQIKDYLALFKYGNEDFSGTPGKNDGLMQAWLSNSLQISPSEQMLFLKKLYQCTLGISKYAMQVTKQNMYLEQDQVGHKLYGKTGSGHNKEGMTEGWFVGFVESNDRKRYLFVSHLSATDKTNIKAGGILMKEITKLILKDKGLFET